jgi:hypothetical protein
VRVRVRVSGAALQIVGPGGANHMLPAVRASLPLCAGFWNNIHGLLKTVRQGSRSVMFSSAAGSNDSASSQHICRWTAGHMKLPAQRAGWCIPRADTALAGGQEMRTERRRVQQARQAVRVLSTLDRWWCRSS